MDAFTLLTTQVWDIGGDAMNGRMLDKYVFGSNAIMLIYDVTNYNSFENLEGWLRASQKITSSMEKPPIYALVANKIDQEHLRTVKSDRHHKFAQENGLLTYAVSAKTSEGVNLCLQKVAAELVGIR
jgi:Ras-related protein Rab-28